MSTDWTQFEVKEAPSSGEMDWSEFEVKKEEKPFAPGTAAVKGLFKGVSELAKSRDPLSQIGRALVPSKQENVQEKFLEKYLPTGESFTEKTIQHIGESLPYAAGGGWPMYVKAIAGGATAEALKEAGAPSWAQNLAEFAIHMSPKGTKGKFLPTKSQKEGYIFLKKKGLTDKEITPLMQTEKKLRKVGKFAAKGPRIEEALKGAHEKIGTGYDILKEKGENLPLPRKEVSNFEDAIEKQYKKLSPGQQKIIKEDVKTLLSKPITGRSMIDFAQDVFSKGSKAGREGLAGYRDAIKKMKGPIREYMPKVNEWAAKDYRLLDEMYKKKMGALRILKPDQLDRILGTGEAALMTKGILTLNSGLFQKALGVVGARALMQEMLINPNLQNLSNQMILQTKKGLPAVMKTADRFLNELGKKDKPLAEKIRKIIHGKQPDKKLEKPQ